MPTLKKIWFLDVCPIILTDFRLDPDVAEYCSKDVEKFCKTVSDKDQRGEVMKCLKKQLKVALNLSFVRSC